MTVTPDNDGGGRWEQEEGGYTPNCFYGDDFLRASPSLGMIRDDAGRFRMIRDDSGRYGSIRVEMARFGSIWDDSGRFGTIRVDSGRFESIRVESARFGIFIVFFTFMFQIF